MKILGYGLPVVALVLVAGFIAYKKFVKKDLWGEINATKKKHKNKTKEGEKEWQKRIMRKLKVIWENLEYQVHT